MTKRTVFHSMLWVIAIGAVIFGDIRAYQSTGRHRPSNEQLTNMFTGGATVEISSSHWRIMDSAGHPLGSVFLTSDMPPKIIGFNDQINTLVAINDAGVIVAVRPFFHKETPAYFASLYTSGFFESFAGRNPTKPWDDLDAISGATITSKAVKNDIRLSSATFMRNVLHMDIAAETTPDHTPRQSWIDLSIAIIAMLLGAGATFIRKRWLSRISLAFGFIGVGWYLNASVTMVQLTGLLGLSLPSLNNMAVVGLLVFSTGFALMGKRTWCTHVCPFGAAQVVAHTIVPYRLVVSPKLQRKASQLRYLITTSVVAVFFIFGIDAIVGIEPFTHWFRGDIGGLLWLYIGVVLAISAVIPRFFCRMLCPTGTILFLLTKPAQFLKNRNTSTTSSLPYEDDNDSPLKP